MSVPVRLEGDVIRLLYIDDDRGLSRLVEKELGRHGYAVTCAPDGDAGLGTLIARPGDFDVVALDHYMPGREGLGVASRWIEQPSLSGQSDCDSSSISPSRYSSMATEVMSPEV